MQTPYNICCPPSGLDFGVGGGGGGGGTVTSVGLSAPSAMFYVTGSPVTGSGTLAFDWYLEAPNTFIAGPTTGGYAYPTFRNIVAEDLNPTYTNGYFLTTNGSGVLSWAPVGGGGGGTVTSVGITAPTFLTVTGSPITTSGTIALTLATQTANRVFVGPSTGVPAAPTFRQLVAEDMATTYTNGQFLTTNGSGVLSWTTGGTVTSVAMTVPSILSVSGSPITTSGTLAVTLATQTANKAFIGPVTGAAATPTFRQVVAEDLNPTYANNYVLKTNGSGVLSWGLVGSPGGADTYVQYNASGSFGGVNTFTYDYTNGLLRLVQPNLGTNDSTLTIVNNNVSSGAARSIYILHKDTNAASQALFVDGFGIGTNATGIQVSGFDVSGTDYYSAANGDRRGFYSERTSGSASTKPVIEANQFDTTASFVFSASYYNGSTNNSILGVWGASSDSGAGRGTVGFRMNSAPTRGVVEIPWISGDNKTTVYIGSGSSNMTALTLQTGGAGTYTMQAYCLGTAAFNIRGDNAATQVLAGNAANYFCTVGGMVFSQAVSTVFAPGSNLPYYFAPAQGLLFYKAGDSFRQTFSLEFAVNTNTKDITLDMGGNVIAFYQTTALSSIGNGNLFVEWVMTAVSYNSQKHMVKICTDDGTNHDVFVTYTTTSVNMLSPTTFSLYGNATATGDITFNFGFFELLNGNI